MHKTYLTLALTQAKLGKGRCAPNPAVGAVIVKNGAVVGLGHHQAAGGPHAEIHALTAAKEAAKDATLYVTLEPCCHHGRTPPCTEALRAAKIKRVFFAYRDPNPTVHGEGQKLLENAGIPCQEIFLPSINDFYQSYTHWIKHRTPWITAKLALSLDGKIAGHSGKPLPITSPALQSLTHEKRDSADALLTTIHTILKDDPQLNVRLPQKPPIAKKIYVLDRELQFPVNAQLLKTAKSITLFHHSQHHARIQELHEFGIRCENIPINAGKLDLNAIRHFIGEEGIHDLWVEAGGHLFSEMVRKSIAHEIYLYFAPKILGADALTAFSEPLNFSDYYKSIEWQSIGNEIFAHGKN